MIALNNSRPRTAPAGWAGQGGHVVRVVGLLGEARRPSGGTKSLSSGSDWQARMNITL